jgi:hypothetical protein
MNEDQLRAMIRDAVARRLGAAAEGPSTPFLPAPVPFGAPSPTSQATSVHPSHYQYLTLINIGDSCVIEPGVTCNHCGYCKTHGH